MWVENHMVLDVWNCKELLQRGHVGASHGVGTNKIYEVYIWFISLKKIYNI
jgi:hypothetical protein